MKRVKINTWKKGVVLRNGTYKRLLNEGVYWARPWDTVIKYDMDRQFYAPVNLNILLQDKSFVKETIVVEVKDNEIVLKYENGLFKEVLTAGRYVYWKGLVDYTFT